MIFRSAFKILTRKTKEKSILGRPKHRWDDNIRMYRNRFQYEE